MATVCITGANRGIGLSLATLYKNRGDEVVALCRKSSAELDALAVKVIENIDVTDMSSLENAVTQIDDNSVDLLINNAGLLCADHLGDIDFNDVQRQFEINAVGPIKVTTALHKTLRTGAKVALITSRMGSVADNTSGAYYGYRMSKAALNAAGKSLANDLKPQNIAVALLHPGFVQTEMVGYSGDISPNDAAEGLAKRIDELTLETSGGFWHSNGERLPW